MTDKPVQHAKARLSVVWICPVCDQKNDEPEFIGNFDRATEATTYCAFCHWPVKLTFEKPTP